MVDLNTLKTGTKWFAIAILVLAIAIVVVSLTVPPVIFSERLSGAPTDEWDTSASIEQSREEWDTYFGGPMLAINLEKAVTKRRHVEGELNKIGKPFKILNGFDASTEENIRTTDNVCPKRSFEVGRGSFGCTYSHTQCLDYFLDLPDFDENKWYLVFEDDATLIESPQKTLAFMIEGVKRTEKLNEGKRDGETFDLIHFGGNPVMGNYFSWMFFYGYNTRIDNHFWSGRTMSTHCYAVKGRFIPTLQAAYKKDICNLCTDTIILRKLWRRTLTLYRAPYNKWFPISQFSNMEGLTKDEEKGATLFSQKVGGSGMASNRISVNWGNDVVVGKSLTFDEEPIH